MAIDKGFTSSNTVAIFIGATDRRAAVAKST